MTLADQEGILILITPFFVGFRFLAGMMAFLFSESL